MSTKRKLRKPFKAIGNYIKDKDVFGYPITLNYNGNETF